MMHLKRIFFLISLLVFTTCSIWAKIELVTLPNRDSVQMTIYNSNDITLVKDRRVLTFKEGMNRLEFSWANTKIDPTSVELRILGTDSKAEVMDISYPPNVSNTLIWNIKSEKPGSVPVEIVYFTSGITWKASYFAISNSEEKLLHLDGFVTVNNNSGEEYSNAQIRLVIGKLNLVESISTLAGRRDFEQKVYSRKAEVRMKKNRMYAKSDSFGEGFDMPQKEKAVAKEGVSDYFIYSIDGTEDVKNQWALMLRAINKGDIPVESYYKMDEDQGTYVTRYYRFFNNKKSGLGVEPLPEGQIMVYRNTTEQRLEYVGNHNSKYVPIEEKAEINLGADPEVKLEKKLMDFQTEEFEFDHKGNITGWDEVRKFQIKISNYKKSLVPLEMKLHFNGKWKLDCPEAHTKEDYRTVKYLLNLEPGVEKIIDYTVTTYMGSRAENR